MTINEIKNDGLSIRLSMEFGKEDYSERKKKVLNRARRDADIRGFRKGMAPMSLIEKLYGGQALAETINGLISESLDKYINENKLTIIGEPLSVEDSGKKNDWENPDTFEFQFDVALAPKFDVSVSAEDKVTAYKAVLTDEEKKEYKSQMQKSYGHPEEDEEVTAVSYIIADFEQGEHKAEKVYVNVDTQKNEDVRNALLGHKKGDVIDIDVTKLYPEEDDRAAALKLDKAEIASLDPVWNMTFSEIKSFRDAEIGQELFDMVCGEDKVKTEEEFDAFLADKQADELKQETDFRFTQDVKNYLVEKADIRIDEDFMKRWIFTANEGKFTKEQIDKEFPMFMKDFKWQTVAGKILQDQKLEIKREDLVEKAKLMVRYQFMSYYGSASLPDEILTKYAETMIDDPKQGSRIHELAEEKVVVEWFRSVATIEEKEVSVAELRTRNDAE
ncbi:MAG: hypothetical protein KBS57_05075 [Alistipes sp.]|nr:hypothetical protein [Candidatus Minthomonas equi]